MSLTQTAMRHDSSGLRVLTETLRQKYFSSLFDGILSIGGMVGLLFATWLVLDWAVFNAVWLSTDGTASACQDVEGACWAVIHVRWRLILFGLYPFDEQWRSTLACLVIVIITVLSCIPRFWTALRLSSLWVIGFAIFYLLMRGGIAGMPLVRPAEWGGLTLTVFIYAAGILIGMPMAICFALLRRSELILISTTMGLIIDGVRSLPLITILFTAALILPFVLPEWLQGDNLYRVIIGFALFFAAYQAEIIRSGMQAIPVGQEEAAKALGLTYWQRISRIILPQAFRNALPPTINQFVISFKETSLVVIIGFFEVLASGNAAYGSGEWSFAYTEVYVFVGFIYFVFVFSLSRYGVFLERRMRVGKI